MARNITIISKDNYKTKILKDNEEHKNFMPILANELGYKTSEHDTLSIGFELINHNFVLYQESDFYGVIFLPININEFQYHNLVVILNKEVMYNILGLNDNIKYNGYKNYQETIDLLAEYYQYNHKLNK